MSSALWWRRLFNQYRLGLRVHTPRKRIARSPLWIETLESRLVPATVQFSAASEFVLETAGTFSIPITLSAASGTATGVPFTLGGTAVAGTDFSGVTASPLTIAAGQTSATIIGTLLPHFGVSQTLIFTLGTPTNATLGATKVNTLTITEPAPTVQFSAGSETVNESVGTFSIIVSLSAASNQAVTVPFTLGGTALAGTAFSGVTASPLTIAAGHTSGTITGALHPVFGASKTLTFTLGTPIDASLGANKVNTLTITEPTPTVRFATAAESLSESAGTFSIRVNLSAASNIATSIPFTLGGSATAGIDFKGVSTSPLVIPAGTTTGTITGTLINHGIYGGTNTKTLTFTLTQATSATNTLSITALGPRPIGLGLSGQEQFVESLYVDELGRSGSVVELFSWVAVLDGPGGQLAVVHGIEQSAEARKFLVQNWYRIFLGRQAGSGEESLWTNKLLAGETEEMVLGQFLSDSTSNEFYQRAQTLISSGAADERFVQALYQTLLHRTASSGEVAGWVGALPQEGRQGVVLGILQSADFRTGLFVAYYEIMLHRQPDSSGLAGWVNSGLDASTVRILLESSSEFFLDG
jgi:hypothetical protein